MEQRSSQAGGPYVVLAIPLLVEGNSRGRWDRVLVVDADESLQLARLMSRDAVSEAEARATLAAQASRAARLAAADDVLVNSGTVAELRQAVDLLHRRYLQLAADMPP
jgi:dephospho-CoA kinase